MERYVLNANSPFKYTLSTEEFTYVEPENIEELFSIYQDITVENKIQKYGAIKLLFHHSTIVVFVQELSF